MKTNQLSKVYNLKNVACLCEELGDEAIWAQIAAAFGLAMTRKSLKIFAFENYLKIKN